MMDTIQIRTNMQGDYVGDNGAHTVIIWREGINRWCGERQKMDGTNITATAAPTLSECAERLGARA